MRVESLGAPNMVSAGTSAGAVTVEVPRGAYKVEASATAGDVTVTGITRDDAATHVIRASATAGDVTITGR